MDSIRIQKQSLSDDAGYKADDAVFIADNAGCKADDEDYTTLPV